MKVSARNQLKGTVKSVRLGTIMSEVVIKVGAQEVVAAITRGSAESLDLRKGKAVIVMIKSTDVMIATA